MAHRDDSSEPGSTPEDVFAGYIARVDGGEEIDFEEWVRDHLEMEDELRSLRSSWSEFALEVEKAASLFHRPVGGSGSSDGAPRFNLVAGYELDGFTLIRVLGQGGMGQVWEAEQLSVRRRVALKVLPASVSKSQRLARRFRREAEAGARLNHAHIVTVYGFGEKDGLPYIVQELIEDGANLADFLAEVGQKVELPPDYCARAAGFVAKLADALQAAHDHGVIHRDVKPQNILIGADDEPKISDFGLARIEDLQPLSMTGEVIGTYCYMSPEQAEHKRVDLDARTDMFSLGATFYEMLTFKRAFEGESSHEIVEKILLEDPPDPCKLRDDIPTDLAVICTKAMEKERADRYQTMADLAADLRRYLGDEPILAAPTGPVRRIKRWARRHSGLLAGVFLAAVLLSVISVLANRANVAARTRLEVERNNHYLQAELAIQTGDLDDALDQVQAAATKLGPDPAGHLMLAGAYASRGRFPESEEQVRLAESAGFSVEATDGASPKDLYYRGLYTFAKSRDLGPHAEMEAIRLFEEAVERAPRLYAALYPLYKLKRSVGDKEGATQALKSYQTWLAPRGDFYRVIESQILELEGDFASAARILEELLASPDVDENRARDLRLHRSLGMIYFELGKLDSAREQLELAVSESPSDTPSLANLARCHYELATIAPGLDALRTHVEAVGGYADRAIALDRHMANAYRIPALAALLCVERQLDWGLEVASDDWHEAAFALERLREFAPDDPAALQLEAHVAFKRALATRDADERLAELERCLAIYPGHVNANIMHGQKILQRDRTEEALDRFRAARDAFDRAGESDGLWFSLELDRAHLLAAQVSIFRAAGLLGLEQEALEAKAAAQDELESASVDRSKNDLLTFAEYLTTAPSDDLVDCDLALDLIWRFELDSAFDGTPLEGLANGMLAEIEEACR